MTLHGYHHRYLKVDLTSGHVESVEIDPRVLRRFIGGTGLGTWLLLRHCPDHIDPLAPENPLIFVFSPLVGSPLTTSAKFAVLSKSPLTGRINDSLSSSRFAIAGKKTGYDAIVVTGRSETPCLLIVNDGDTRLASADSVWGLSSQATEEQLAGQIGPAYRVASIGPAGENLVHFATISNEGRHAGRGGPGAVMGSKRLKAIAVQGSQLPSFAHPEKLIEYSRDLSKKSFGPATEKYRELGTVSNLLTFNRLGTLPTRNFQSGSFDAAAAISPEAAERTHLRTRSSCAACTIGCEHIFHLNSPAPASPHGTVRTDDHDRTSADSKSGDQAGSNGVRLEYESLFALGSLCGISESDTVLQAAQLCDEFGLDTISAGGTIAFAMECAERNLIHEPTLRFGRADALLNMLRKITFREGLGELLSLGSRAAADRIGQGSEAFAPHVKGLEIPGYEPRALQTMALGFAVGTRGADHNRSGAYQVDFSDRVDRFAIDRKAVPMAIETEDESALMDSLILCRFLRGVFEDRLAAMTEMLQLVTGATVSVSELKATARRIVTIRKLFNIRQGWQPEEDTLPERFFSEPLPAGLDSHAVLNKEQLDRLIQAYNLARGWSAEGWVSSDLQTELELDLHDPDGSVPNLPD